MSSPSDQSLLTPQALLCLIVTVLLGYLTYFHNYAYPPNVFWDENYHIASAQKYLHGVYFMEPHPPLGKLLIALGEKIFHPNPRTDQFLGTDYGTEFPKGFSFAGYRFFSALLAWWTAPMLFVILLLLTRNAIQAMFVSFFYVFDNALIVHMRGAMLEGPLLFFSALTLLSFFLILETSGKRKVESGKWTMCDWSTVMFGMSFACAMTTKVVSLVFVLLVPIVLYKFSAINSQSNRGSLSSFNFQRSTSLRFLALFLTSFIVPYVAVWQTHFALGSTINKSLPDAGYYQASSAYKKILKTQGNASLLNFPVMLADSWRFVGHYNAGAPRLDLCKDVENGSPFYFWPLGARAINYRWETPDGNSYRYLYLQSNPVVWWVSFAGVLLGAAMLLASLIFQVPLVRRFELSVLLGLHVSYMLAVSRITRVMYLYHYFLPLMLSFLILAIVISNLHRIGAVAVKEHHRTLGLMILGALIVVGYQFYRPLTYYLPMTDAQFKERQIFQLWELTCIHCERQSGLVVPR